MPVVTISSQFGAGARDVGRRVADRIGLQYVDQAVLVDAARQLGVTVRRIAEHDERTDSLKDRLSDFLQRALERSAVGGNVDPLMGAGNLEMMLSQSYQEVLDQTSAGSVINDRSYLETITGIITDLAARGDVVIMGRGSQMILRGNPDTVHIQCVAEDAIRLQRVMQWEGLSEEDALRRMDDFNRSRADFHKKFWKADVWETTLYDLVVNTRYLSYDAVAELVLVAVQDKTGTSAPAKKASR